MSPLYLLSRHSPVRLLNSFKSASLSDATKNLLVSQGGLSGHSPPVLYRPLTRRTVNPLGTRRIAMWVFYVRLLLPVTFALQPLDPSAPSDEPLPRVTSPSDYSLGEVM